jgi:hypothetical protein
MMLVEHSMTLPPFPRDPEKKIPKEKKIDMTRLIHSGALPEKLTDSQSAGSKASKYFHWKTRK